MSAGMLRVAAAVAALAALMVFAGSSASSAAPSYRDEVMADGPAGYWRFGETSGTVAADETANSNPGTYQGGVTRGVTGALATDANKAARFDGGNDMVSMGDPASGIFDFGTGDFTAEAWVKTTFRDERAVIGKRELSRFWQVTVTDDPNHGGQVRANVNDGTVTRQAYSLGRVDDGVWHHVVVLFDRDTGIRFYIDGAASGSTAGAMTGDVGNAASLQVGKVSGYGHFKGDLDEVAVYRSLLTVNRIQAHFHASILDTTAPFVGLSTPAAGGTSVDTTPAFSGTSGTALGDSTTVTVEVYSGGTATGAPVQTLSTTRAPDGTFSVDATSALTSGQSYTAQAEQADRAGNVGVSEAVTFSVDDGTPPPGSVAIAGAGDIAWCGNPADEATAELLENMPYATVFTNGDNAYPNGSAADYANCYEPSWGRVKARTFPAAGGHDYATPGAAAYFDYFGAAAGDPTKGYYSYDLGAWHIVVLNSECNQIGGCGPGSPQEIWLRRDLAANLTDCTLAYWHEPRFSSGSVHGSHPSMQPFWQALYEYGADVVIGGDDHLYERFLPQKPDGTLDLPYGITQFVVGTGGYLLYDFGTILPNSAARINDAPGVLKLVLHAGRYDWKFLPIPGETSTDSGSANCHGTAVPPPPPPPLPPPPGGSTRYFTEVTADTPRAYWRLGETSGTTAADERDVAPGTYLSGVTLGVTGALAETGNSAARFDGGDDRVSMGDPADGSLDFGTQNFTVEAWVKATANDERAVISKKPVGGLPYWQVTVTDDGSQIGRIRASLFDGVVTRHAYGPAVRVDDSNWHHVAVAFDRDTGITIYVDGTNSRTTAGAMAGNVSNAGDLLVGKATGYPTFKGELDEVAVYLGLLSAARIQEHHTAGREG